MRDFFKIILSCIFINAIALPTNANVMLNGFGGDAGYGELAMTRNDDGSSNELNLPFTINFFGNNYDSFFVNNNGNISFNSRVGTYIPTPFPIASQPMIAPFWSDVDTRCDDCGEVYVGNPSEGVVAITWNNVGEYSNGTNGLRNSFQAVLIDRSADTGTAGDFDVEFRYEKLEWTHGANAQAGYDSGNLEGNGNNDGDECGEVCPPNPEDDCGEECAPQILPQVAAFDAVPLVDDEEQVDFYALPGSFSEEILELQNTSNTGEDGVWRFAIRDGALPGETPENPIMPVVLDEGWGFEFNVDLNERVFIDPDVAVGYEYYSDNGNNFRSVRLPSGYDDDIFSLWLLDNGSWVYITDIVAGQDYDFGPLGVSEFRVEGIDTDNMVDPDNPLGFVTGLTFVNSGGVQMRQVAITEFVDATAVSEPNILFLMLFSLGFLALRRKQAKK